MVGGGNGNGRAGGRVSITKRCEDVSSIRESSYNEAPFVKSYPDSKTTCYGIYSTTGATVTLHPLDVKGIV